jgi:hypothetical protein
MAAGSRLSQGTVPRKNTGRTDTGQCSAELPGVGVRRTDVPGVWVVSEEQLFFPRKSTGIARGGGLLNMGVNLLWSIRL